MLLLPCHSTLQQSTAASPSWSCSPRLQHARTLLAGIHGRFSGNSGLRCARLIHRGPSPAAHCFVLHHLHHAAPTAHHHRDSSTLHEPVVVLLVVLHSVLAHLHHRLSEACPSCSSAGERCCTLPPILDEHAPRESSAQHPLNARRTPHPESCHTREGACSPSPVAI